MSIFLPLISLSEASEQSWQGGWTGRTFFCKKELLLAVLVFTPAEIKKGSDCWELKHIKMIFRLIYWEILYFNCYFVSQIRSSGIMLEPKQQKLMGALTLIPTWGLSATIPPPCSPRPQLTCLFSKAGFAFHLHLISKSSHLCL